MELRNEKNTRNHHMQRAKRARRQRESIALAVWSALRTPQRGPGTPSTLYAWTIAAKATAPKHITLTAHVARKWDTDGLVSALSHVRDGLQDCGLIQDDGPESGHRFVYRQVVSAVHGVTVSVRCR